MKARAVAGMILLVASGAIGAGPVDRSAQVDALFAAVTQKPSPGAAVMVIQDGKVVHKKGYGLANVELGVPCTAQTKFRIASLTKAFTAMAAMILHEKGLFRLDDSIDKYLPDFPNGAKITIRQLLTHTSGVQEPAPKPDQFDPLPVTNTPLEKRYAMCRDEPLEFEPGTKWSYTNAGYIVLGCLLEKVTGQSYEQIMAENIFKPLGMTNTNCDRTDAIVPGRAAGYCREGEGYRNASYFDTSVFGPAGCLYSTIEDMILWDQALGGGKLVKADLLAQAFSPAKLSDGSPVAHYGFGWVLGKHRGLDEVRATGMMPGFEAQIIRIPSQRFSVVVLSNCIGMGVFDLAHQIAEIYLAEHMETQTTEK